MFLSTTTTPTSKLFWLRRLGAKKLETTTTIRPVSTARKTTRMAATTTTTTGKHMFLHPTFFHYIYIQIIILYIYPCILFLRLFTPPLFIYPFIFVSLFCLFSSPVQGKTVPTERPRRRVTRGRSVTEAGPRGAMAPPRRPQDSRSIPHSVRRMPIPMLASKVDQHRQQA